MERAIEDRIADLGRFSRESKGKSSFSDSMSGIDGEVNVERQSENDHHLTLAVLYTGMVDEIRRDFNAGGQIYRTCTRSYAMQRYATQESNLERSIRNRNGKIEESRRKEYGAVG